MVESGDTQRTVCTVRFTLPEMLRVTLLVTLRVIEGESSGNNLVITGSLLVGCWRWGHLNIKYVSESLIPKSFKRNSCQLKHNIRATFNFEVRNFRNS